MSASVVRRIRLEQLSEAHATLLLGELDPRRAAAIYRHGGGNPFYLEQLARAGQEATLERSPKGAATDEVGVPAAVVASLADELTSLSVTERMLLAAAAVAGEPFEPDLAATYLAPLLINLFGIYVLGDDGTLNSILTVVSFAINIWALVELGCLRGTIGGNQYGGDPLAPQPAPPRTMVR